LIGRSVAAASGISLQFFCHLLLIVLSLPTGKFGTRFTNVVTGISDLLLCKEIA
jgi:hypothetical protein